MKDGFYINLSTQRIEYYRKRQLLSAIPLSSPDWMKGWFVGATVEHVLRQPDSMKCKVRWDEDGD